MVVKIGGFKGVSPTESVSKSPWGYQIKITIFIYLKVVILSGHYCKIKKSALAPLKSFCNMLYLLRRVWELNYQMRRSVSKPIKANPVKAGDAKLKSLRPSEAGKARIKPGKPHRLWQSGAED